MTLLYECLNVTTTFLVAMLLAHFVFLVPTLTQRLHDHLFVFISALIGITVCVTVGQIPALIVSGMLIGIYIFIASDCKKRRYLHALTVLPIMGFTLGILVPPIDVPSMIMMFRTDERESFAVTAYFSLIFGYIFIRAMCSNWYADFQRDVKHRKLGQWEQVLLWVIGMLMLIVVPVMSIYDDIPVLGEGRAMYIHLRGINSAICFVVSLTVGILVLRSSQNVYLREQVMQMQNSLIVTMADIVENRDENTGGHIRRTAKYVEIIGVALKTDHLYTNILTDRYIADMVVAAPLHDIGKIHIPDAVLKKEGRFTEEEFQIMKSHTTAGKRLLLHAEKTMGYSTYLSVAVQMAGYHHEWWNGQGYPEGLKGQDIPLCARIMAVADVFDSLISKRCYKGAMDFETAFNLIRHESGTHFDPAIVEVFLDCKDEIMAIAKEFKEAPVSHYLDEKPLAGGKTPIRPELDSQSMLSTVSSPAEKSLPGLVISNEDE